MAIENNEHALASVRERLTHLLHEIEDCLGIKRHDPNSINSVGTVHTDSGGGGGGTAPIKPGTGG